MINLLPRRDNYVLWYFDPGNAREVALSVSRDGVITMGTETPLHKKNFSNRFFVPRQRVPTVVALHPSYSWSAMVSLDAITHPDNGVTLSEYEELVGHLLERSAREYRSLAAQHLGIHELDAVVVDAYIGQFRARGSKPLRIARASRIANPRRILCITFTTRDILDALTPIFHSRGEVFFTDAWRAEAIVAQEAISTPTHYIVLHEEGSYCYALAGRDVPWCAREEFPWRTKTPITLLANSWNIPFSASQVLFRAYYKKLAPSPHVHAFFSSTFSPAKRSFFDAMSALRLHGTILVRGSGNLPFAVPVRYRRTRLDALPVREIFKKLGVDVRMRGEDDPETLFSRVAPFLEYDRFGKSPESLHGFLRRRIHWIFSV